MAWRRLHLSALGTLLTTLGMLGGIAGVCQHELRRFAFVVLLCEVARCEV